MEFVIPSEYDYIQEDYEKARCRAAAKVSFRKKYVLESLEAKLEFVNKYKGTENEAYAKAIVGIKN